MKIKNIRILRRVSQTIFLVLFLFLLLKTEFRGTFKKSEVETIRLNYPVRVFLEFDPLVVFSTSISTHSIYKGTIWALIFIGITLIFGRAFCGWVCPLGTLNHFFSHIKLRRKGAKLIKSNKWKSWQIVKYYILIGLITAGLFTSLQTGLIDPIPFLVRSLSVSILPAVNYGIRGILNGLYQTNIPVFQHISDFSFAALGSTLLSYKQTFYHYSFLIGVIFITVLALNRVITRFWCRGICPLGAFLGLISRFSIFGLEKYPEKCTECNRCLLYCQGGDDPHPKDRWKSSECHLCLNCQAECPEGALKFKFFPSRKRTQITPDFQRRRILTGIVAGAALVPVLRATSGLTKNYNPRLIRPPGSLDEKEFLKRCIRCGECMKVCPTNAIQPTFLEAGVEGMWTPMLIMRIGYCEHTCVLCSQVCPTGAIWRITEEEKLGIKTGKPVKIGTAFYDRGRCLPWAMDTPCIVCEEFCPTSPKAVWLKEEKIVKRDGTVTTIKRPYIDPKICWGCGICEHVCPVQDKPAVYVTSIGESRSKTNQILLEKKTDTGKK
ncbi:ferredoxin [candidate division KSB1 bacterium]|nr:MAG: ferredoxin [candidate division KSB1 bacterium]